MRSLGGRSAPIEAIRHLAPIRAYEERALLEGQRRACLLQLPVLLDVLTLGLSAGLSFDASLELYCTRYDDALAHALAEAMVSWRIGLMTRSEALSQLARRLDIAALQRFASTVTEALAFGSPLAEVLEHQAQAIRDEHRSHVEEAIEKVPVKMLIPLGTLIVPAMLLAILGPLMGPALRSV
ncbi:MAG: type II secretion system F family protein [Coriobacteriaceae bacterium]|nr:type II secretion system F family protein [Coriobacteriaceae bacterium]